jgi:formylglycine-generating enzyme required for sulfatase activity
VKLRAFGLALLVALAGCEQQSAPSIKPAPEGMVLVPAGEFLMGSDEVDTKGLQEEFGFRKPMYLDEHPRHKVKVDAFYIDLHEVTNGEYKRFVFATGAKPPPPWIQNGYNASKHVLSNFDLKMLRKVAVSYFQLDMDTTKMKKEAIVAELMKIQAKRDKLPVNAVNWYDAASYCRWREKRLPTEAEWEKAARGPDGRRYPWGDKWDQTKTNVGDNDMGVTVPPGTYPEDKSVYGALDMGGNVSEWVNDWYNAYLGADYQSKYYGDIHKVVKGGGAGLGHYALSYFFRSSRRGQADPSVLSVDVGFRCAQDVAIRK